MTKNSRFLVNESIVFIDNTLDKRWAR